MKGTDMNTFTNEHIFVFAKISSYFYHYEDKISYSVSWNIKTTFKSFQSNKLKQKCKIFKVLFTYKHCLRSLFTHRARIKRKIDT